MSNKLIRTMRFDQDIAVSFLKRQSIGFGLAPAIVPALHPYDTLVSNCEKWAGHVRSAYGRRAQEQGCRVEVTC